jgi:hypothetical protein
MVLAHAKDRAPSSAARWIPCPYSATVEPMYGNAETEASNKGDLWHAMLEDLLTFGCLPKDCDPDAADMLQDVYDYVQKRFKELGPNTKLFIEQRLDITETGEFGTADVLIVSASVIEVVDEKSGYVPVNVVNNKQLLTYLCGAIDLHGPRPKYKLGVHQPNFDHVDGPLRFWEPTEADIAKHREQVLWSVANPDHVEAGPHCKATYCPHRGSCEAFRVYVENDLSLGWFTSERKGMSDEDLAKALDASDEAAGYRAELRAEAMRRIAQMDRHIPGYKLVKGRRNREVREPQMLVHDVAANLGAEWAARMFTDIQWAMPVLMRELENVSAGIEPLLKHLGTPKHIEDVIKQYARQHNLQRGGWKKIYDNIVGAYIAEHASGLSLEKAIDGRPAHRRGSEFGVIPGPATSNIVL